MEKKKKIKKRKNKSKKTWTRKGIIIFIISCLVVGVIAYFLGCAVGRCFIKEEETKTPDFKNLSDVVEINELSIDDFITDFNELILSNGLNDYRLDRSTFVDDSVTIGDFKFDFAIENDYVGIIGLSYKEDSETAANLVKTIVKANNSQISDENINLFYEAVIKSRDYSKDDESSTTEFFQYQGVELSEKTYFNEEYKYKFRIGRITE